MAAPVHPSAWGPWPSWGWDGRGWCTGRAAEALHASSRAEGPAFTVLHSLPAGPSDVSFPKPAPMDFGGNRAAA
eukprot:5337970-Lingulodinium_polyedra.AAC.1